MDGRMVGNISKISGVGNRDIPHLPWESGTFVDGGGGRERGVVWFTGWLRLLSLGTGGWVDEACVSTWLRRRALFGRMAGFVGIDLINLYLSWTLLGVLREVSVIGKQELGCLSTCRQRVFEHAVGGVPQQHVVLWHETAAGLRCLSGRLVADTGWAGLDGPRIGDETAITNPLYAFSLAPRADCISHFDAYPRFIFSLTSPATSSSSPKHSSPSHNPPPRVSHPTPLTPATTTHNPHPDRREPSSRNRPSTSTPTSADFLKPTHTHTHKTGPTASVSQPSKLERLQASVV